STSWPARSAVALASTPPSSSNSVTMATPTPENTGPAMARDSTDSVRAMTSQTTRGMAAESGGRLAGKAVIVTGASRGTGEVTARLLASHGADVALFDVRDDLGAAVAKDIGGDAIYVHCDVSSEADWAAGVAEVVERFGRLDVLV